jgi:hypothetical protein
MYETSFVVIFAVHYLFRTRMASIVDMGVLVQIILQSEQWSFGIAK